jgi:hypothetical protein
MSVRSRRLAFAAVTAAMAIAVPTAALASGSSTSPGKPGPSAAPAKPAAASKPAASRSGAATGSAAAIKSAARQSAASGSVRMSAMVATLATRLGVSHSAAQRALNQVEALGREGIEAASPAFAAFAHDLGVSSAQLSDALRAAKQSLGGR